MSGAVIERVRRLAPLGLELIDAASGRHVGDGLIVRVAPRGRPQHVVIAQANPSGVFVAHDLPGLGDWSHGGDEPLPHPDFDIRIDDRLGRFLPCCLRLTLPTEGLAHPPCRDDIPLFSAPTRITSGLAAIRAEIVNHVTGKPAAWSLVEVRHGNTILCLGMADGKGRLLLAFPYPTPAPSTLALDKTAWPLTLHVRHQPGLDPEQPPELCAALAQPAAKFVDVIEPFATVAEIGITLRFGYEVHVTHAAHTGGSQLLITP